MAAETSQVFISYNRTDRQWAERMAAVLEEGGFSVVVQAWDFPPGQNFILAMQDAAARAQHTVLILSPSFAADWAGLLMTGDAVALEDDRIGQLYDQIARMTESEDDPSSPSLREAWAELRELQSEEARRDREEFKASLAMPIDAGERILERARASRERFEDLAARHRASE